jgi:putative FmdB family regulatory protein
VCQHRFDKRQRFDDEPAAECPRCHGSARRVFHPAPIIFKGSGFYVTDSRKPGGDGQSGEKADSDLEKSASKEGSTGEDR